MHMYEYLQDSKKVLRKVQSYKKSIFDESIKNIPIDVDYNDYNKNQLVHLLVRRKIPHNKRWLKKVLVSLLEENDKQ